MTNTENVGPATSLREARLVTEKQIALPCSVAIRAVDFWVSEHIIPLLTPSGKALGSTQRRGRRLWPDLNVSWSHFPPRTYLSPTSARNLTPPRNS